MIKKELFGLYSFKIITLIEKKRFIHVKIDEWSVNILQSLQRHTFTCTVSYKIVF